LAAIYNGKGLIYDKLKEYQKSLENFSKAVYLEPNNPVYIHNRGCLNRQTNK
jgi:tetratricopeptide (TPR) repeat protein